MILQNEINESSTTKNIAIEWLKLLQLNINRLAGFLGGLIPTQVLTWSGSTVLEFKSVLQAIEQATKNGHNLSEELLALRQAV